MGIIKKLIAGILSFLAGLLPKAKKGGSYYLELEEAASETKPEVKPVVSESKPAVSNGTKAAEKVKTKAPAVAKTTDNGKTAKPQPESTKVPVETTFAPKYLIPSATSSNGRRRPGANMSAYLDLARQIKTPQG